MPEWEELSATQRADVVRRAIQDAIGSPPQTLADVRIGGLTVEVVNGRYCPMVICDACGQRIRDPKMANVEFVMSHEDSTPFFGHKGRCDRAIEAWLEQQSGDHIVGWEGLDVWLTNLLHNTGMHDNQIREGRKTARMLADIG